jgi:hypothetical protein
MAPAEMARGAHRCRFTPTQQVEALANDSPRPWFTAGALRRHRQAERLLVAARRPLHLLMRLLGPTWVKAPVR